MRVSDTVEAWKQDETLFFDDSFEHEVWSDCPTERVLLQVVILHPDLADGEGSFDESMELLGLNDPL